MLLQPLTTRDAAHGRSRVAAGAAALAAEALLVAALILGLAGPARIGQAVVSGLTAITLTPAPRPVRHSQPAGASGAAARRHQASPVPQPRIVVAPPMLVAAAPRPAEGAQALSGASDHGDAGTGAGGAGNGTGAGGNGDGTGSGGSDPELVTGQIRDKDYPESARAAGHHGATDTDLAIAADGRVSACRVTGSSGDADLDAATCRLVLKRFRFLPARDAGGHAVAGEVQYTQDWDVDHGDREGDQG